MRSGCRWKKLLAPDLADLGVAVGFELREVAHQVLAMDFELRRVEDAGGLGVMHDPPFGDARLVHAPRLGDLRALLVGERFLLDTAIGILFLEPLHYNFQRTLWRL